MLHTDARPRIRLLIIATVRLHREGVAAALAQHPGIEVAGVAGDLAEAVELTQRLSPDQVVFDMSMHDGVAAVRYFAARAAGVPIVAFAVADSDDNIVACAEAGVAAYVPCDGGIDDLVASLESITRGETRCSPHAAALLFRHVASLAAARNERDDGQPLTVREWEVLALLERGCSNKEIACRLHIEVATVKNHVHSILAKLQVTSRAQAARRARAAGGPASRSAALVRGIDH